MAPSPPPLPSNRVFVVQFRSNPRGRRDAMMRNTGGNSWSLAASRAPRQCLIRTSTPRIDALAQGRIVST